MKYATLLAAGMGLVLFVTSGCSHHGEGHGDHAGHGDHDAPADPGDAEGGKGKEEAADHGHEEKPIGESTIGGHVVSFAQGHGGLEPGKECHLVVKLPYTDKGATIVRAWIGTEDRTLSLVGKGEYAASHDDYDVHATAPNPLPPSVMWWVELEKPDGTKSVGSVLPLYD